MCGSQLRFSVFPFFVFCFCCVVSVLKVFKSWKESIYVGEVINLAIWLYKKLFYWVYIFHFAPFNRYFRVGLVRNIYIYIYIFFFQNWEKIQLDSKFKFNFVRLAPFIYLFLIFVSSELLDAKIEKLKSN